MAAIPVDGDPGTEFVIVPEPTRERSKIVGCYNKYLQTRCDKLKVCQMLLGLASLILVQRVPIERTLLSLAMSYLGFNVPLVTAVLFWDSHNNRRLQRSFKLDQYFGDSLDLYLQGAAALLYYVVSFGLFIAYYHSDYYPMAKFQAGTSGMLAFLAHVYNWWLLFREENQQGIDGGGLNEKELRSA